jgi:rhamnulokinase/L-fuculokinase
MIPDLFNYFLTGEMKNDYTTASTAQILDARARVWSKALIEKLGVNTAIFKEIVMPGTLCGTLLENIKEETGAKQAIVYNVASHDTASAVSVIPVQERNDYIYISSGTWSLIGTEISEPLISEKARYYNFTNEGGTEGNIRFLKNVMGSFLVQESKKQWEKEGKTFSFDELDKMYDATPDIGSYIDVDDPVFVYVGNMPKRIAEFCRKTSQRIPETEGEFMRVIYNSLALKYRYVIDRIKECTGGDYNAVHIIGGGSKSKMLCQLTASATGLPVFAGPTEATTIGNAVVQWIASGDFKSTSEARNIVKVTFPQTEYFPGDNMDKEYNKYLGVLSLK